MEMNKNVADDNFCSMVGYSREEIHELFDDRYIGCVDITSRKNGSHEAA